MIILDIGTLIHMYVETLTQKLSVIHTYSMYGTCDNGLRPYVVCMHRVGHYKDLFKSF